jgi:hypothetical protein
VWLWSCAFSPQRKKADSDVRNPNQLTLLKTGCHAVQAFATKEPKNMEILSQNSSTFNSQFKQPQSGKRLRRHKIQTLSALITTSKTEQGFIISVTLYAGRTRVAGDLLHVKDCQSPERAWLEGYYRAQAIVEGFPGDLRLYITNQTKKEVHHDFIGIWCR